MKPSTRTLKAEARLHEAAYTLGDFNRYDHSLIEANRSNPAITSVECRHLLYKRGHKVVKISLDPCSICEDQNINLRGTPV